MPPSNGGPAGYTPPDGGWGWAVVVGAFISIGFSCAFGKSISVFYKEIEEIFKASTSEVSWLSSIGFSSGISRTLSEVCYSVCYSGLNLSWLAWGCWAVPSVQGQLYFQPPTT